VETRMAAESSALRLTWASPLYRGATAAMFPPGLGFSAAAPQIASFLVNELGASFTAAGAVALSDRVSWCQLGRVVRHC